MYKVQELINKGLQVEKLPADVQDAIETLKALTDNFVDEDEDGRKLDEKLYKKITEVYQSAIPAGSTEDAPETQTEPEPAAVPESGEENPLIGDNFFKKYPEKVLGEQSLGGKFGKSIVVKGSKDKLNIEVPPVTKVFTKFTYDFSATTKTKEDIIAETEKISIERKKHIRKKAKEHLEISEEQAMNPDVYTFREVSEQYNKNISREELEAFLYANPIIPFEKYIDSHEFDERKLVEMGYLFYENNQLIYKWIYASGDIHRRMTYLKRDESIIKDKYGDKVFENQMAVLNDNMPTKAVISVDDDDSNRIVISCISEFAMTVEVKGNEVAYLTQPGVRIIQDRYFVDPRDLMDDSKSLNWWFYHYLGYVHSKEPIFFKGSGLDDCKRYVKGEKVSNLPESGQKVNKDEAAKNKKRNLEAWERARRVSEKLFNKFLFEELFTEAKMKVEILWNEKFNTYKSPMLDKIPVGFTMSKFIRRRNLKLNETQRESVAFINYNRSGLLALEVGLGKTIASIASISQAVELGLAKRPLVICPKNVYLTWLREIMGYKSDIEKPEAGCLPHFPPVMELSNCNEANIMKNKNYSDEEWQDIENAQEAIENVRKQNKKIRDGGKIPDSMFITSENPYADYARRAIQEVEADIQNKIDKLITDYKPQISMYEFDNPPLAKQLTMQLQDAIAKLESKKISAFQRVYLNLIKEPYAYLVYMTGKFKNTEPGTIALATEEALKNNKLGCRNSAGIIERMFYILSGGQKDESGEETDVEYTEEEPKSAAEQAKLLEKIKANVEARIGNAKVSLEDLGFDMLVLDEAHHSKKVFPSLVANVVVENGKTKMVEKKKGKQLVRDENGDVVMVEEKEKLPYKLGSGSTSGSALSAFALTTYIQETTPTGNTILCTATPFENDPLEIYSMLTLSNYQRLIDLGFGSMKKFFETFMQITFDYKVKLNGVEKALLLSGFQNLVQFRNIVRSVMLHRTGEQAQIDRPDKIIIPYTNRGLLPESVKEVKAMLMPTAEQVVLIKKIEDFVVGKLNLTDIQTAETEKYLLEQTLREQEALQQEAEKIEGETDEGEKEEYEKEAEELETIKKKGKKKPKKEKQTPPPIVNATLQIESEKKGTRIIQAFSLMRQITLSPYALKLTKDANIRPTVDELVNSSPKLQYILNCIKSVKEHHESKGTEISGQIIYSTVCKDFFELIKEYLVNPKYKVGFPESQVKVLTGDTSDSNKEEFKSQFKAGIVKVLIASETIQVGANLQDNSTVMYHLFYDWNPTDNEQINGRIWRQGNNFAAVRIVYPMVENSVDQIVFQYLGEKTNRIKDVWDISGVKSQLDLSEFDPNRLKLAALTDPIKKADFFIQVEHEEIKDEISYLQSKYEIVKDLPKIINYFKEMLAASVTHLLLYMECTRDYRLSELLKKKDEDMEDLMHKKTLLNEPITALEAKRDDELFPLKQKIQDLQGQKTNLDELLKAELLDIKGKMMELDIDDKEGTDKLRRQYKDAEKNFKKDKEKAIDKEVADFNKTITSIESKYNVKLDKLKKEIEEKIAALDEKMKKVEEKFETDKKAIHSDYSDKTLKVGSPDTFPSLKEYYTFMSYQATAAIKWLDDSSADGRWSDEMSRIMNSQSRIKGDLQNYKNYKGQYERIKAVYLDPMGIAEADAENIGIEVQKQVKEKKAELEQIGQKHAAYLEQFTKEYELRMATAKTPAQEALSFAALNFLLDERTDVYEPEPEPEVKEGVKAAPGEKVKVKKGKKGIDAGYLKTKIEMFEMALETAKGKKKKYLETKIEIFKMAVESMEPEPAETMADGGIVNTFGRGGCGRFANGGLIDDIKESASLQSYLDLVDEGLMKPVQFVNFMHKKGMLILPDEVFEAIRGTRSYKAMIDTFEYYNII